MLPIPRRLPAGQRYPFPTRRVTMNFAKKLAFEHKLGEGHRTALTLLAHFSYGAAVGGIFGIMAPKQVSRAVPVVGASVNWSNSARCAVSTSGISRHIAAPSELSTHIHSRYGTLSLYQMELIE